MYGAARPLVRSPARQVAGYPIIRAKAPFGTRPTGATLRRRRGRRRFPGRMARGRAALDVRCGGRSERSSLAAARTPLRSAEWELLRRRSARKNYKRHAEALTNWMAVSKIGITRYS